MATATHRQGWSKQRFHPGFLEMHLTSKMGFICISNEFGLAFPLSCPQTRENKGERMFVRGSGGSCDPGKERAWCDQYL